MVNTASELIRRIDFFQPLDDRLIDRIARVCINREYSSGDYIVRQGDPGLGVYFRTRGAARVEITLNGAVMPIAQLQAGEFVGELSIIDNKPRSANVICSTDASCLLLTRDSFMKLLNKYPEIALQMARALAARLRSTDEKMWQGAKATPPPAPVQSGAQAQEPSPPAESEPRSDRQKIKDMLADTVSWVYPLKAVTQFSLAVVGCPVSVDLETRASRSMVSAVGALKLVLVPSYEDHVIGVHPFAEGTCTATILRPLSASKGPEVLVSRFRVPVHRNESFWLHLPGSEKPRMKTGSHMETGTKLLGVAHMARPISSAATMRDLEAALDL